MRYLAWFALPLCAALLTACLLPAWWLCWPCALAALLLLVIVRLRRSERCGKGILLFCGAAVGFCWFGLYFLLCVRPALALDGLTTAFTAEVTGEVTENDYGTVVDLRLCSDGREGIRTRAYLSTWYGTLEPGDVLTGTAKFTSVFTLARDRASSYTEDGIFLTADVEIDAAYASDSVPLHSIPARIGRKLKAQIDRFYGGEEAAVLRGLLTGDKTRLNESLYTCFRRAGIAHLLAVSGLHVGFLAGLVYLLPGPRRRKDFIAIPVMIGFALLTGGQSSVWRAVVMGSLLLVAPLFRRETDPPTSLAFALALLLVPAPYSSLNIGLQLSFAATAGLVCYGAPLYRWMLQPVSGKKFRTGKRRLLRQAWSAVAGGLSTSCAALIFTLPLTAWYFGTVSLVGPLVNLLVVWAASLAFGLGLIGCSAGALCPAIGFAFAAPTRLLLRWIIAVSKWMGSLRYSALRLDNLYLKAWFAFLLAIIVLMLAVRPARRRPLLPTGAVISLLTLALALRMASLSGVPFCVSALDVGQGACTVFSSDGAYAAVDCGGSEAGDVLADYLQSGGASKLSVLILTHYDNDHVNGVEELLERIPVEMLILPGETEHTDRRQEIERLARAHGCRVERLQTDCMDIALGSARLTVYPPVGEGTDNAACLSVLGTWQSHAALITGDLAQEQERILLERYNLPRLDVLMVGHHGSSDSTGAALLAELSPRAAVISVGSNSYGLPTPETLRTLADYRCEQYRTDRNGTVTFRFR
ncbi:MAG: DNA internalization-related competence protein ComEC/Rec2 [Oscillospiraceae bacterium]|nr:DNA internalization-related competence protein ComEC/Rec2 [Oscillospiraceae bacterium]